MVGLRIKTHTQKTQETNKETCSRKAAIYNGDDNNITDKAVCVIYIYS